MGFPLIVFRSVCYLGPSPRSSAFRCLARSVGGGYIDTTRDFVAAVRERERWLHYAEDAHPTVEGQRLIAESVARQLRQSGALDGLDVAGGPESS